MGVYTQHVLPRIVDVACNLKEAHPQRRRACDGLAGEVVEIGFGSGLNVPFYPPGVTQVTGVEPSDVGWKLAGKRLSATSIPVQRSGLDGQSLPFEDHRFDAALSTWTMCTIPDLEAALAELARVLRPGGLLHFAEHGRAPDVRVRRWQDRLQPVCSRAAGGCHPNRPIADEVRRAGLEIDRLETSYLPGPAMSRPFAYCFVGRAHVP